MKFYHRVFLGIFGVLIALTCAGIVLTSDWGNRAVSRQKSQTGAEQSPVDMRQIQTARALVPLASTPDEQSLAHDALRMADHEVDFEFTAALYQAASQPVPSTAEIKAILARISAAQKKVAELNVEISRVNKLLAAAKESEKDALQEQLDLANARLELNQDEYADAGEDLERAGGDPQSRIQRLVAEHKTAEQDSGGELDYSIIGKQAGATLPVSNSFLSRARAFFALRALVERLKQAQQDAAAKAASFSGQHDQLERQLEQAQAQQSSKLPNASDGDSKENTAGVPSPTTEQTRAAISAYRSLSTLQKTMSSLDGRIRNQQDLAAAYEQWGILTASRERSTLHGLIVSIAWVLLIGAIVLISDWFLAQTFARLEPDRQKLLTLRTVAHFAMRAAGLIVILLVIFGLPSQMATVLALAGAGLTVVLKDFIVGFFGWFILMGKDGIRHGDWVEINGVSGEVIEIGLFHTVLLETGNWNDSGHPTGRRVTFVNSYAIEGHYFNFSTSGQWLWDELQVALPANRDPYPVVEEIRKIVEKETEANTRLAETEWEKMGTARGIRSFSAGPAISVRPAGSGFEILVRYVTRANERHRQRSKLYFDIVELLRQKDIPQAATTSPAP